MSSQTNRRNVLAGLFALACNPSQFIPVRPRPVRYRYSIATYSTDLDRLLHRDDALYDFTEGSTK